MSKGDSGYFKGTIGDKASQNEGIGKNTLVKPNEPTSQSNENAFSSFPTTIHTGKQGKHIPNHNNYQPGKSILTVSIMEIQDLVIRHSGKGTKINDNKERVDFGKIIGKYVDPKTGQHLNTTNGIIHYSKNGTHVVPSTPNGG